MSIYFLVPWFGIFAAKVMIIPNTFLLNSCRIRKNRYLCEKEKVMIDILCFLIVATVIVGAITAFVTILLHEAKKTKWKSPYTHRMMGD